MVRGTAALTLILFAACGDDTLTGPVPGRLSPAPPDLTLTGAPGTPIFPFVTPSEGDPTGFATGLNASGQATGGVHGLPPNANAFGNKPFRWTPGGEIVKLTPTGDANAFGADINAAGAIAGSSGVGPFGAYRGFVATGNTISILPLLPGLITTDDQSNHSRALALNDALEVVGYSPIISSPSYARRAVRWSASGVISDLGTLGGRNSEAVDINNAGQIIGTSQIAGDAATHAFLWTSSGGMQDLNTLLGASITEVVEINDAGQIVGTYTAPGGQAHAFRYSPGSGLLDLGTLGGTSSAPTGLNGRGEVVGTSTLADNSAHAFLWTAADGMEDITALTGVPEVRRLNDNLQTLTGTLPPTGQNTPGTFRPRLVQLAVTQSNAAPFAIFTSTCNGLTCTLDASNSLDDRSGLAYAWDLGKEPDGFATGQVVTVTYAHESQRTVTLTVTDAQGLRSSSTQTFTVIEFPVASFTYSCTGLTCSFEAIGSADRSGRTVTTFIWAFGDGGDKGVAPGIPVTHTYAQPGTYDVRLEAWIGSIYHRAVVIEPVTVTASTQDQPPVARFTSSCSGTICTLDASTSTDDVGIVSYDWNLDKAPGGTASGVSVTTDYWHTSTRTVTLTVTDTKGQQSSVTQAVNVP
jgi:probable HAF family extracellular repeat protein